VHRAWTPELPMSFRDRIWKKGGVAGAKSGIGQPGSAHWIGKPIRWLAHHMLFPDPQLLWAPSAFHKACRIVEREGIDTVIVNMPPYSLLKVALALKKRFSHLKLITDFRDEWLGYYLSCIDRPTQEKVRRAWELEAEAVHASAYVCTVTDTWVDRLRNRYPGEPAGKFICTPNGYEPEMFRDFSQRRQSDGKIIVTYFGTVHDNQIYSPENYLAAIAGLPDHIGKRIETRFIGRVIGGAAQSLKQSKANVRLLGFMPKERGMQQLQESDFVLLIATDPSSHAGKLFDYFASGKPILALSPPGGEIDRILRRTRAGWCADPWNLGAIQQMMTLAFRQLSQGLSAFNPDQNAICEYSWPNVMNTFAAAVQLRVKNGPALNRDIPQRPMSVGA
jgi:glycosyltransferase involved in cell wall biosynthesis